MASAAKDSCCYKSPCEFEIVGVAGWILPDGTESAVCPRKLVTPLSWTLLSWYQRYRRGILPHAGGLFDQAAPFAEAMLFIDSLFGED